MTTTDTLLVGGTDIQSVTGVVVMDMSEIHNEGAYRGENVTLPGRPGAIGVAKVREAFTIALPVAILGDDRADFVDVLAALSTAIGGSNLVTLTRRLTTGAGVADETAAGEYLPGEAVALLNPYTGRTVLKFVNLDGGWTAVP